LLHPQMLRVLSEGTQAPLPQQQLESD